MRKREKMIGARLNQLIALDWSALELCERAAARGLLADASGDLAELAEAHRRHIKSLMLLVDSLGLSSAGAVRAVLTRDAVFDEAGVLEALYANATKANHVYDGLLAMADLPVQVRGVVVGNCANHCYHTSWLEHLCGFWPAVAGAHA